MIIIFELTGEYRIILPLMFATVIATWLSRVMTRDTIYTTRLRRRGIDVASANSRSLMAALRVRDAMQPLPLAVPATLALEQTIVRLASKEVEALPVVDESGRLVGVLTREMVERSMQEAKLDASAGPVARATATVHDQETLEQWSSQDLVETPAWSFLSRFKLLWAEAAQMAVTTRAIVERIDVIGEVLRRQLAVVIDVLFDPLLLQAAEERFGDGVVPAVAFATHAWLEPIGAAEAPPGITAELRSLI